jgi:aspartate dehydrogenase
MNPLRIAIIGEGAITTGLLEVLAGDASLAVVGLITKDPFQKSSRARELLPMDARTVRRMSELDSRPDLLVECAGHAALIEHVIPGLRAGVPAVIASTGALSDARVYAQLEDAARSGGARVHLIPGAVGAIDVLAAALLGGLKWVTYVGRKPPLAWRDTPAEARSDLNSLRESTITFEGSAREAAALYPRNANVAATVALAGIGLDETMVRLEPTPPFPRTFTRSLQRGRLAGSKSRCTSGRSHPTQRRRH